MSLSLATVALPLSADSHGTIRVGGTRVTLDLVVTAFTSGLCADEIAAHFPALSLPDIYTVLGFYLNHTAEVDAYIEEGERRAAELQAEMEALWPGKGRRERLQSRLTKQIS